MENSKIIDAILRDLKSDLPWDSQMQESTNPQTGHTWLAVDWERHVIQVWIEGPSILIYTSIGIPDLKTLSLADPEYKQKVVEWIKEKLRKS